MCALPLNQFTLLNSTNTVKTVLYCGKKERKKERKKTVLYCLKKERQYEVMTEERKKKTERKKENSQKNNDRKINQKGFS